MNQHTQAVHTKLVFLIRYHLPLEQLAPCQQPTHRLTDTKLRKEGEFDIRNTTTFL